MDINTEKANLTLLIFNSSLYKMQSQEKVLKVKK